MVPVPAGSGEGPWLLMTFLGLIGHNLRTRLLRAGVTAVAVAIAVTAVMALGVLTFSLKQTAVSILRAGKADFSVAQEGVSDVLYSSIDQADVDAMAKVPGVQAAVGALVSTAALDRQHPFFIQIGLKPASQADFGVRILEGRSYRPLATDEMLLGYRAAKDLGKRVGDTLQVEERRFKIVGIFSTGNVFGDAAGMFPLPPLQEWHRKPGLVTLAFVQAKPGVVIEDLRNRIEEQFPQLATARSESDYGRVDRNLVLISAANVGGSLLALFIGATSVLNTSLLSFYERIREFGLLRATGWSRRRMFALIVGEALVVSFIGAGLGVVLGFAAVRGLTRVPDLVGVFKPAYDSSIFARSLSFAFLMALLGAAYPAVKAAALEPLSALRRE